MAELPLGERLEVAAAWGGRSQRDGSLPSFLALARGWGSGNGCVPGAMSAAAAAAAA